MAGRLAAHGEGAWLIEHNLRRRQGITMRIRKQAILLLALTFAVSGCSPGKESAAQPAPTAKQQQAEPPSSESPGRTLTFHDVSGYTLPGFGALAKIRGFNDCTYEDRWLDCSNTKPEPFYGEPVQKASVSLMALDFVGLNGEPIPADQPIESYPPIKGADVDALGYRAIHLEFKSSNYVDGCTETLPNLTGCAPPGTINAAINAMEANGWVLVSSWKGNRTWMHPEHAVSIEALRYGSGRSLTLVQATPERVAGRLAAKARADAEKAKADAEAQRMVDAMKVDG